MANWDSARLRGRIREKGYTEGEFWQALGHSPSFGTRVFKGLTSLTITDVETACNLLEIPIEDIGAYFCAREITEKASGI